MLLWEVHILKKLYFVQISKSETWLRLMVMPVEHLSSNFQRWWMGKIEKSQKDSDGSTAGKRMAEQFVTAKEDRRGFHMQLV